MRKIALITLALFVLTALAAAQIPTSGNIFVGYSFENTDWAGLSSGLSRPNLHGWEASLEGKVFPHVGIVADFAGHYGSEGFTEQTLGGPVHVNITGHEWEVLFGPRLSIPVGNLTPFAEAMFGVAHIHNGDFVDHEHIIRHCVGWGSGLSISSYSCRAARGRLFANLFLQHDAKQSADLSRTCISVLVQ